MQAGHGERSAVKAVWMTGFGDPEVLVPGEAPDPKPAEG